MADLSPIAPKLALMIPRLASDQDGEVLATVAAIRRTLAAADMDLHDLAAHVGARLTRPSDDKPKSDPFDAAFWQEQAKGYAKERAEQRHYKATWKKAPSGLFWADMARMALDVLGGSLNVKERTFLDQMALDTKVLEPTEKQAAWLLALHNRARLAFR